MPRTLITGGAGFLGSHLCDYLLEKGHEVLCMDNFITGSHDNIGHIKSDRFQLIEHNVTQYIEVEGPLDYILHFASPASPIDYLEFPIQTLKVGSLGTHNALGLAREKKAKFLLASTSDDEAKRFAEAITMAYHRVHGIDVKIVRIFNTYGPRMRTNDGRAISNFLKQALTGKDLTAYGEGTQTRSFCYVSDLVEGIYRLLISNLNKPVNIGNPVEMTIQQMAEKILQICETPSKIIHTPLPKDDPKIRQPNISKAKKHLKWEPRVKLDEGLKATIEYFKEQLNISDR